MFFVHPQIKLNKENLKSVFSGFFKSPNLPPLEKELTLYFPEKKFVFTDMGRSCFKIIIERLNLQDSQIILPAYICDIFYPILKKYNIKPIFADIDIRTFNIEPRQVRQKFSPDVKAILVSHTYGLPTDIKKIKGLFVEHQTSHQKLHFGTGHAPDLEHPLIIEDCAHVFGAKLHNTFVGNLGDISFFSIYKQFPTLRGGLLVYPKDWDIELPKTGFGFRDFISLLNCFPFFAFLFKKFGQGIAPKMLRKEKMIEPAGINSVSLNLFSDFLEYYKQSLRNRIELALFFQEELKKLGFEVQESENNVFCYFSALMPENIKGKRDELVERLRKEKVFCTRIWHTPIILNKEAQKEYQVNLNDFPSTVEAAGRIINFPLQNHYTESDIKKMVQLIKKVLTQLQEKCAV